MIQRLQDKVAFITGGNSGIGLASAQEFAAQGARVVILARTQAKADQALARIEGEAAALIGDVSDLPSLRAAFKSIEADYGELDIVMVRACSDHTGSI